MNPPLGLAVSGGGDSMALLHLAVAAGVPVSVATVDHGLRAEAADEAAGVARSCAALGVPHAVLHWHWDGAGNLQDSARRGRLALLSAWARQSGLSAVALGHTQDDVAETFLMRLARGAGVDGLSAMAARREVGGVTFLRPLLAVSRGELRDWLRARGAAWVEDPSNANDRFARVRARRSLSGLADAGLSVASLAAVASQMAEVREALDAQAAHAAAHVARIEAGDVLFDAVGFARLPAETRRRLLLAAVMWISSAEYGPRGADMIRLRDAVAAGRAATLAGVRVTHAKGAVRLTREARAVAALNAPADTIWDNRWKISGGDHKGLTMCALGAEGLRSCPDWRATGLPRASLLAAPALWRGDVLVAAPLARFAAGWQLSCAAPAGILAAAAGVRPRSSDLSH
ncbi:tRNA lysidine(34) synthetase TilS [Paragemmobacter aquarius]|uniref:tRNA lysidine(34) synthetase TilS n=1 Tax=Paragemmobacter aquarius TaxID=2169400 RepID=UPI001E4438D3|nr:tRNA lysidine(34) synthetase TilS [Gemmobacter aquarius]